MTSPAEATSRSLPGETIAPTSQTPSMIGIEQHSLDVIPDAERRGRPRLLGLMWTGVVLNVLTVVYGALLVSFGLNLWQCFAVIVIGNLSWIITGLASLPGPSAGTTTFTVNRVLMGVQGNRLVTVCNWLMQIGYEVLDMVLMALAVTALLGLAGVNVSTTVQVGIIIVLSVAQAALPVLGHRAITTVLNLLAAPCAVLFLMLAWLTASRFDYVASTPAPLTTFLGGVALVASSSGLGWAPNATDMSRYLPRSTRPVRLVAAVAIGGGIPQILLMGLGAVVAYVSTGASDPVSGLKGAYPTWFVVVYLLFLLAQLGSLNGLNCYSSGLTLQAAGVRLNRWQAVLLDSLVCTVLSALVLTSADFYTAVSNFLLFSLAWFSPWAAIYVVAWFLRRGVYDIDRPPLFGPAAFAAQLLGVLGSLSWLVTTVWSGWFAKAAGHADLSVPVGLLIGGGVYFLLVRFQRKPAAPPTSA